MKSCFNTRALVLLGIGCLLAIILQYLFNQLDEVVTHLVTLLKNHSDASFSETYDITSNAQFTYLTFATVISFFCLPIAYLGMRFIKSRVKYTKVPTWAYTLCILVLVIGMIVRCPIYHTIHFHLNKTMLGLIMMNLVSDAPYIILAFGLCMSIFMNANRLVAYIGAVLCGVIFFTMSSITHGDILLNLSTALILIMLCGSRLFDIPLQHILTGIMVMEIAACLLGSQFPLVM